MQTSRRIDLGIPAKVRGVVMISPGTRGSVEVMNCAQSCPQCQQRILHGGCPLDVFDFDQGRYMCDSYLDSFSG